uniref:Leucine rich repeat containing 9 n=1 Tax=Oryzias sinensis TaxID=183150 RepID=A0A8C7XE01_9TELE
MNFFNIYEYRLQSKYTLSEKRREKKTHKKLNVEAKRFKCLVNGVSYEKIAQEGSNVTSLEIFFSGFPRMVGLFFFPRLCQLTIVDQTIEHIEGLENCPLLQQIWIVQCRLREISGLQNCQKLEKLYLYNNQICEIQNLDLQVNLEVLWLNNNCITKIQGLDMLQNLKELNLADNLIEKIGNSLDPNVSLEILNLSGNQISSFKELAQLAHLPRLKELALKDPMSTPNPVCLLCNYATHVLYHIPGLQQLDSYNVSDKQVKEAAEAAVMKKMMYYNMRVRSAKRNLSEKQLSLTEKKKTLLQMPEERIRTLSYALKKLECELSTVPVGSKTPGCMWSDDPGGQIYLDDSLQTRSDSNTNPGVNLDLKKMTILYLIFSIEAWCKREKTRAANKTEHVVQFLYMELESVGNIRLEAGCPTDLWFNSCCNLLVSRFAPSEYKTLDVIDIKVDRVFRIHNSALRHRFVEKRRLEYLFYIADPGKCEKEETFRILQEGFTTTQQKRCIFTSLCVSLFCLDPTGSGKTHTGTEMNPPRRQWFVFQHELVLPEYIIYFEYILEDQSTINTSTDNDPSNEILDKAALNMEPVLKLKPELLSLNNKILLNVANASALSQITVLNLHGNSLSEIKEISRLTALRHLTISFNKLTYLDDISYMPSLEFLDASFNHLVTLDGLQGLKHLEHLDVCWNKLSKAREITSVLRKHTPALLKLDTRYNPWSRITSLNLDDQRISKLNSLSKLENLRWASFDDNNISRVDGIDCCLKLEELSLNNNCIATLKGLGKLRHLKKLSVDGNQLSGLEASVLKQLPDLIFLSVENNSITTLDGIQNVQCLLELYIGKNRISSSRDVHYLKGLGNLIILDLYGNALTEKLESYRIFVIFHLTSLKALDGVAVDASECESAKSMFKGRLSTDMVVEKLGHSNYTEILYLTLHSCSIRMVDLSPAELFCNLCSINLDHNNLTSFSGLIHLPNLKALSLNYNHIESILPKHKIQAPLTNRQILHNRVHSSGYGQPSPGGSTDHLEPLMGGLEVLHLSHNGISNMANLQLSRLTNLKSLFLQGNDISQVEGLEGLQHLRELVLDRNRIKALARNSFTAQSELLELHLEYNRIRELNHLDPLVGLQKLFLGMNKLQVLRFFVIHAETYILNQTARKTGSKENFRGYQEGHVHLLCSF